MDQPIQSCPQIDEVISQMEQLRDLNSELRDYGNVWREEAERLEALHYDVKDQLEAAEEELDRLTKALEKYEELA